MEVDKHKATDDGSSAQVGVIVKVWIFTFYKRLNMSHCIFKIKFRFLGGGG